MRKTMKIAGMVGAAMSGGLLAQSAHASFIITLTAPVASGGDLVYQVQALDTAVGADTGTNLLAFDSTITTPGTSTSTALVVDFVDIDGDGVADADVIGAPVASGSGTAPSFGTAVGTFERLGASAKFNVASVTPADYDTDPGGTGSQTQSVDPAYSDLHSLEIAGFTTSTAGGANGVADSTTPVSFANVVVPAGTTFTVSGDVGGNTGSEQAFTISNGVSVPEPASIGVFVMSGAALLRRRRRRNV